MLRSCAWLLKWRAVDRQRAAWRPLSPPAPFRPYRITCQLALTASPPGLHSVPNHLPLLPLLPASCQSLHGGIFSPSPKSRARPSDSNARQSLSIAARPSVMPELRAAAAEAAAAAAAVEQGAVDQPVAQQAQQAQQAEPAAAAAAVEPEAAAGEPSAAAQQAQQQHGAAEQAAGAFERTGSSPLHPAGAKRQRTSPRRSPPKPFAADSGGCWVPVHTYGACVMCRCGVDGMCLSNAPCRVGG